jgi:dTDP-4-amino-4,6-dideoxygalactose transaminase
MYVPTWQGLNPTIFFRSGSTANLPFPLNAAHKVFFYRARNAIYHLFRSLRFAPGETVLVPAYHHGNEVRAIRAAGVSIRFYPITRALEPDLDALKKLCRSDVRALFVIHYLGWPQPIKELTALCRERGLVLIEDCALALFSETDGRPLGSFGDYAIYCLYKTLPLPHGGLLVQNTRALDELAGLELEPCSFASVAGRNAELTLEWLRSRVNGVGKTLAELKRTAGRTLSALGVQRLPVGDTGFDPDSVNTGISPWSVRLLHRFDYAAIPRKRREHFLFLYRKLAGRATLLEKDLAEGVCPLFFPLLVPDKRAAAEALWRRGIGAVEFWNEGDPEASREAFPQVQFLRDHLLELPIHQELTPAHLEYMARQVLDLKLHF